MSSLSTAVTTLTLQVAFGYREGVRGSGEGSDPGWIYKTDAISDSLGDGTTLERYFERKSVCSIWFKLVTSCSC